MTSRTKPANLIYDVDESPKIGALVLLGFQHIFLLAIAFVFPVLIIDSIGGSENDARHLISMAMLVTGIATILQGLNKGPVGSGYLCPLLNGPAFLSASIMAGKAGGLPLIFGMTFIAGLFEAFFSRVAVKMRAFFPAEVTGTIVTMVGIEVIPFSMKKFVGMDATHLTPDPVESTVALVTLAAMIGLTVWGKGKIRLFSVLIGMLIGYTLSFFLGIIGPEQFSHFKESAWFSLPALGSYGLSFSTALIIPFVVAALSSALKTMGDLTTCQAFMPKIAGVFVIMPTPVMGASLIFAVCFMVLAGIQIMLSRMIDSRKTFVIGMSIIFGLSVDLIPGIFNGLPGVIKPFFQSSLSVATLCAIILNMFMRIGIAKTAYLALVPGVDSSEKIFDFMHKQGSLWGAMPDVIDRAAAAINETFEAAEVKSAAEGPLQVAVSFDEFNLDVEITYLGTRMVIPDVKPSEEEIMISPEGLAKLSLFLIHENADRVESHVKNGQCRILLHYNH